MSSISSVSGASSAWPDPGAMRAAMKERMFAKVDTDGSGSVDKSEMQTMVEAIAIKSGKSVGSADELMTKMDGNGDGSLSSDELDAGMKSLLPAPSSTVDFAQQHGRTGNSAVDDLFAALDTDGDGTIGKAELSAAVSGPPPGPPPEGPPPAGGAAAGASGASGTGSTTSYDPLDTNEDGVVSVQERMAGEVQDLLKAMDTNGDQSISAGEVDSFVSQLAAASTTHPSSSTSDSGSSTGDQASNANRHVGPGAINPNALGDLVREEYTRAAAHYASTTTVDAAA
jgi:Ca2+-binding EF-hand superfamily protein